MLAFSLTNSSFTNFPKIKDCSKARQYLPAKVRSDEMMNSHSALPQYYSTSSWSSSSNHFDHWAIPLNRFSNYESQFLRNTLSLPQRTALRPDFAFSFWTNFLRHNCFGWIENFRFQTLPASSLLKRRGFQVSSTAKQNQLFLLNLNPLP